MATPVAAEKPDMLLEFIEAREELIRKRLGRFLIVHEASPTLRAA